MKINLINNPDFCCVINTWRSYSMLCLIIMCKSQLVYGQLPLEHPGFHAGVKTGYSTQHHFILYCNMVVMSSLSDAQIGNKYRLTK